ncbi:pyridoxal phosphate-dependent aminotransferase [Alicyclobacillus tolerans]|uniref:pyridoxal phosphate-dependent aminotransferase n=1 Tax=Alicyclobacillus tolerans TaxID=90970 RepID=UPI001F1AF1D0|nr:pyridoxal phosphate-dependent aminotransferase [Alicyclobacillus tolerans]MCF8564909.1 pyridoxal phosphate-dependent aminotransferase [Alicyclobacillus tolerans]
MKPLASIPVALPPQGVRVIMDLAWQVEECIHLEVGEPNFQTPQHIVEAAMAAGQSGFTKYTPNSGIPELRDAIANKMKRYNQLDVTEQQVCVHHGAVEGIFSTMLALVEPGDEVLMPGLSWPNGEMAVRLLHGVPIHYSLASENAFLPNLDELERLVTPRTKALVVNSPGNPTGTVFDEALVRSLAEFAHKHDLWLVSDEIYEHIVFDKAHVSPGRFAPERTITISGFSKAYAMTGWRLGYTVSPPEVARIITKLQEPIISSTNSLTQKAGVAALNGDQTIVETMRQAYHRRRDIALGILKEHQLYRYTPQGAFYLMIDVSSVSTDSMAVAKSILQQTQVAVAPGEAFGEGGAGLVRVSLANSEENIEEGIRRICEFINRKGAL